LREDLHTDPYTMSLILRISLPSYPWIVKRHIPFTVIKDVNFQAILKVLTGTKDTPLLTTGNSVRNKIENKFIRAQDTVKGVLARAKSRIHVSYNL